MIVSVIHVSPICKQDHGGVQALVSRGLSVVSSVGSDNLARLLLLMIL